MTDARTIHAVSHTHWDREWYFSTLDTQLFALKAFNELIVALEANPHFVFHLDGQSSLYDDFIRLKPEMSSRAQKLVQEKRLLIGPWYTQPDLFNITTESMFRNLRIGIHHAQRAGYCMSVLYLPDSFGSHAQLPQIARAFGLQHILLRRGYDPQVMGPTELCWEALNGDRAITAITPFGYSLAHPERGGRWRNFRPAHLAEETFPLVARMKKLTPSAHLLCPIGGDQVSCDADFDKLIAAINLLSDDHWQVSSYERYFAALDNQSLPLWRGEFRIPRLARVHKSIGSSRYDIKKANADAERCLIYLAEPMLALARRNGFEGGDEMLEQAWRWLLESHAHDSMGGCNSDETNRDVLHRCRQAQQIGEAIFSLHARQMLANIAADKNYRFLVSNGSSSHSVDLHQQILITPDADFTLCNEAGDPLRVVVHQQRQIRLPRHVLLTPDGEVETEQQAWYYENTLDLLNVPVPPLGIAVFYVTSSQQPTCKPVISPDAQAIENDYYRLHLRQNQLVFTEKTTGRALEPLLALHDISDDGDLYDFSPLSSDIGQTFPHFTLCEIRQHQQQQVMCLSAELMLPEGLNEDRQARSSTLRPVAITLTLTLEDDILRGDLTINNTVREHRMQLVFNTGRPITGVRADIPFGSLTRHNQDIAEHPGYAEKPVDIEPFMHQLSPHTDFHVFANGLKEYTYQGQELAVTLFRGVGQLGKDDLFYRPGRASGQRLATPEGNLPGALNFSFALCLGAHSPAQLAIRQQRYSMPARLWQWQHDRSCLQRLDNFDLHIPRLAVAHWQLLEPLPDGLVISGVDVLYGKTLVRLYNPTESEIVIPLEWYALVCNALGEPDNKRVVKTYDHLTLSLHP